MDYRGMILSMSPTGRSGNGNDYICTAHYGTVVEIVPAYPGTEAMAFPPIRLSGPGPIGVIYESRKDDDLIRCVRGRCASVVRGLERGESNGLSFLFGSGVIQATLDGVRQNLARLESLDGDQPASVTTPMPSEETHSVLDEPPHFISGFTVIDELKDSTFHPNYVGRLVFIEIPLECDERAESGEYIIVEQSADSLYGVKTTCCLSGVEVVRIPFALGDKKITILNDYEDDDFVREFIERLDDMDTEDHEPLDCDLAETAGRQLSRMLEQKRSKVIGDPLNRLFAATDRFFNRLGCLSGRISQDAPECCGV